jgi:hypothetical protein
MAGQATRREICRPISVGQGPNPEFHPQNLHGQAKFLRPFGLRDSLAILQMPSWLCLPPLSFGLTKHWHREIGQLELTLFVSLAAHSWLGSIFPIEEAFQGFRYFSINPEQVTGVA